MPEIGDMYLARVNATFDGEPIVNSLTFVGVAAFGTWTEAAGELAGQLNVSLGLISGGGQWADGLSVQYKVNALEIIDVSPGVSPLASFESAVIGTVTDDDAMPPNDCLCVTLRSDFKGPSGRGRMYLNGFAEGSANGGYWEAGAQAYAAGIAAKLVEDFGEFAGAASFRWSVLHRMTGGVRLVPPEVKPIMSFSTHNEVRSIGRRAVGRKIRRRRVP